MLYSMNPLVGLIAVIAAGTLAFFAFKVLDRHSSRRSE